MPRGIAYVKEVLPNGWLSVVIRGIGEEDIPEGLKVNIYGERNGREYYRILEGVYKGKHASSPVKRNSSGVLIHSYFTTTPIEEYRQEQILYSEKKKKGLRFKDWEPSTLIPANLIPSPTGYTIWRYLI
jgi:hypothetical protein